MPVPNPENRKTAAPVSTPLVEQVTDSIRRQYIEDTELSALPSERQLAVEQNVSRKTIRKAVKQIEDEGLVQRRGSGKIRYIRRDDNTADWSSFFPNQVPNAFSGLTMQPQNSIRVLANDMSRSCRVERLHRLWEQLVSEMDATERVASVELKHWPIVGSIPPQPLRDFDLLQAAAHNNLLYDNSGDWYPLEGWLQEDGHAFQAEIWPPLWQDAQHRGRMLGLPFQAVMPCLVANRELWQQADQGDICKAWSWKECLDTAERLTASGGNPAFTVTNVSVLLNSMGFDVYAPRHACPTAEMAETLTRLCRMVTIHDVRYILEPVAVGRVPFSIILSCSIAILEQQHPGRFIFLPHPVTSSGWFYRYVSLLYLAGQALFPAQCWQLMKFLVSAPVQNRFAAIGNAIPANRKAWPKFAESRPERGDLSFLLDTLEQSRPLPLNDRQMLQIETDVLGPEFLTWYQKKQVTETDLFWLQERLVTYCEQRLIIQTSVSQQ